MCLICLLSRLASAAGAQGGPGTGEGDHREPGQRQIHKSKEG